MCKKQSYSLGIILYEIHVFYASCSFAITSFLFQLQTHNTLNTYIYHQLPLTRFGVFYTIFRETIALFAKKLYVFAMLL